MINKDTFCISPWTDVRINSDGKMNFCHYANRDMIPAEDQISQMPVGQYFSSSGSIVETRALLKQGKKIDRCMHCYKDEEVTPIGFRQRHNLQAAIFTTPEDFDQSLRESTIYQELESPNPWPRFYHISFSNVCNMACVMCDPVNSSMLANDWNRAGLRDKSLPIRNDWTDTDAWTKFLQHLIDNPDIVCLHIMGGEPLFHRRFRELVEFLIEKNHTDFNFTFVTNGTIFEPDLVESLKKFKSVQIEISIENIDSSNDYIRWPGNTGFVMANIQQYLDCRCENIDVVLRSVPQALSLCHYDKFLDFCLEQQVIVDSNLLYRPEFFHPKVLDIHTKKAIENRLTRFLSLTDDEDSVKNINIRNKSRLRHAIAANAKLVIDLMFQTTNEDILIPLRQQMVEYMTKLDRSRNVDARTYMPELAALLDQNNYEQQRFTS